MLEYFEGAQHGRRIDGRPEESRDDCRWRRDWKLKSGWNWTSFVFNKKSKKYHLQEWVVIEGMISWGAATLAVGSIKLLGLEDEGETLQFPVSKTRRLQPTWMCPYKCATFWTGKTRTKVEDEGETLKFPVSKKRRLEPALIWPLRLGILNRRN